MIKRAQHARYAAEPKATQPLLKSLPTCTGRLTASEAKRLHGRAVRHVLQDTTAPNAALRFSDRQSAPTHPALRLPCKGRAVQPANSVEQPTQKGTHHRHAPAVADHPPHLVLRHTLGNDKPPLRNVEQTKILTQPKLAPAAHDIVAIAGSPRTQNGRNRVLIWQAVLPPLRGRSEVDHNITLQTSALRLQALQRMSQVPKLGLVGWKLRLGAVRGIKKIL